MKELVIAVTCSNQDDKKIPINQSVRESHLHSANLCNIRHSSIWELVRDTDIVLVQVGAQVIRCDGNERDHTESDFINVISQLSTAIEWPQVSM